EFSSIGAYRFVRDRQLRPRCLQSRLDVSPLCHAGAEHVQQRAEFPLLWLALGPAVFDADIAMFDVTGLAQSLSECSQQVCELTGRLKLLITSSSAAVPPRSSRS